MLSWLTSCPISCSTFVPISWRSESDLDRSPLSLVVPRNTERYVVEQHNLVPPKTCQGPSSFSLSPSRVSLIHFSSPNFSFFVPTSTLYIIRVGQGIKGSVGHNSIIMPLWHDEGIIGWHEEKTKEGGGGKKKATAEEKSLDWVHSSFKEQSVTIHRPVCELAQLFRIPWRWGPRVWPRRRLLLGILRSLRYLPRILAVRIPAPTKVMDIKHVLLVLPSMGMFGSRVRSTNLRGKANEKTL